MRPLVVLALVLAMQVTAQHPKCDNERIKQLKFIRKTINTARIDSKDECKSYGWSPAAFYQIGFLPATVRRLGFHIVCMDKNDLTRKIYVEAKIRPRDLGNGGDVNPTDRKALQAFYKTCGCDQACHIMSNELGGNGYANNLFAQNADLNNGLWKTAAGKVTNFLRNSDVDDRFAMFRVSFVYEDPDARRRPSAFFYQFNLYSNNELVEAVNGMFENEPHFKLTLSTCQGNGVNKLLYVDSLTDQYIEHRTCRVDNSRRTNHYGPTPPPTLPDYDYDD